MAYRYSNIYYPKLFETNARYIDLWGGRARGGSYTGTLYFLQRLMMPEFFRGYFMRQIFNDIRGSLWKDILDRIEESEIPDSILQINENGMVIKNLITGNEIISKGFKKQSGGQTAKLKSLAGATHILIEEADEIEKEDFEKLDDSVRTKKVENVQIIRIFNATSKDHWIVKDWYNIMPNRLYPDYFNATPKSKEGFLAIFGTYIDNIENLNESSLRKIEHYKNADPSSYEFEHYLTDYLGLIAPGNKGRVYREYELFDQLPENVEFYRLFAQDWGGNDPNALVQLDFDKKTKSLYIQEHMYVGDIRMNDMIELVKKVNPHNHEVICDSARLDNIREYQSVKINAIGVKKGEIIDDINRVKKYKLFVHKDAKNTIFELNNYVWMYDKINDIAMNKPIDKHNHALDAVKYGVKYYDVYFGN